MTKLEASTSDRGHDPRALRRPSDAGFTLIELLVVITILGILSAVVVFSTRGISDRGEQSARDIDERTLRTAEEAYCAKNGRYATESELVAGHFLANESTNHNLQLSSGGRCGTGANTSFTIGEAPTAVVDIAANTDQWVVSDTGSGPGYHSSAFVYPLNSNMHEPLIIIGSDYSLQPGLAASWELIPTSVTRTPLPPAPRSYAGDRPYPNATWRMHLRQGVTFHDGSAFDAADVIWSWRDRQPVNGAPLTTVTNTLGFTHQLASTGADPVDAFDSVEYIDQYTVDFTPRVANLRLPEQIGHPKGGIVPTIGVAPFANDPALNLSFPRQVGRHFDGSTGALPGTTKVYNPAAPGTPSTPSSTPLVAGAPIGTGPFEYVSYVIDISAATQVYDGYWGSPPQVARMNYTFLPDRTARTNGLLSGQYDMAIDLNPLDVTAVEAAGFNVVTASYGQNALIYVNKVVKESPAAPVGTAAPPGTLPNYRFNLGTDPAIRRAVSLAMNRPDYVNAIYDGNADPGRWMAPPGILGPFQSLVPPLTFDPAQAASVLDAAGWTCPTGNAGTACVGGATRTHPGPGTFSGRELRLVMIGTPDVSQNGYDLLTAQMAAVGIDIDAIRANCNTFAPPATACAGGGPSRGQMYNSSMWDLNLEVPNQNDANPAFLPVLRMSCLPSNAGFRFAPVDGVNATGPAFTDTPANGGGTYPFGNNPCNLPPSATLTTNTSPGSRGPMDLTYTPNSNTATTQAGAQEAAANQMRILVNQNETNVVIPVAGQFRIYAMTSAFDLGDPHPSQTSQRWDSLSFVAP